METRKQKENRRRRATALAAEALGKQTHLDEHKLKYPEASLSSFLKLVLGFS